MPGEAPPKIGKPFRVVLDTNVYYSALHSPAGPLEVLLAAGVRERRYRLLVSPFILHELHEKLMEKFVWEESRALSAIKQIVHAAELVHPQTVPAVIADDPDDDSILACAVVGQADLIISGDRHLLQLKEYAGIPIVRPMDFLRTLGLD